MTGEPNNLSDIYGQAVALRATCYWELCRWYGDVPHALNAGEQAKGRLPVMLFMTIISGNSGR